MISVRTNTNALFAQAAIASARAESEAAMDRLSSGKRINAAKDDAAGVAISTRQTSQIRGMDQSIRNALDAQSLIDTAEGGLQEITESLQRIRELAVQAASDTYSAGDRAGLDSEAQQLLAGIDAIASNTTWAGQNLLDGALSNKSFQVGAGSLDGDNIAVSLQSSTAIGLGLGYTAATAEVSQVGGEAQPVNIADGTETTALGDLIRLQSDDTGGFSMVETGIFYDGGWSVSGAGDLNGDGLSDIIVGAPGANANSLYNSGKTYIVFGKQDGGQIFLREVPSVNGIVQYGLHGGSISGPGDVNGDGLPDFIIGADYSTGTSNSSGQSFVIFGGFQETGVELSSIEQEVNNLGFAINGINSDDFGGTVSMAGDVNGDGLDDLIVGIPSDGGPGSSYVIFGKSDSVAVELSDVRNGLGGFVINGEYSSTRSGYKVSGGGDVNGDGLDDIIIASNGDLNYVVFGKSNNAAVELSDVSDGVGGFAISEIVVTPKYPHAVSLSNAGDVNGDGLDDIIIGDYTFNSGEYGVPRGESFVVFGKTSTSTVDLTDVFDGVGGFRIKGAGAGGFSVSGAGDVNGDGLADVIVGSPHGDNSTGKTFVVFGKTDSTTVDLNNVRDGVGGFVINGYAPGGESGYSVSGAGDVNGDGLDDVIIGAPLVRRWDYSRIPSGESYVVFGKTDGSPVELSDVAQNPPALSSNASIVIHDKTIAIDLSSYYDGSTNDYYGAAAAVAAVINSDTDLQALDYSAIAATSAQVAAGTHLAGDVIVSRADTPITTVATNEVSAVPAVSLTNHSNAQNALTRLDTALQTVNSQRAELGALSNRLDHIVANNTNALINSQASQSRIQDADFAVETSKLARAQMLTQASTAMLAQANASVYDVLTLLPD